MSLTRDERIQKMKEDFRYENEYLSAEEVDRLYDRAVGIYLDITFPYSHDIVEIPEDRPRDVQWVRDCMTEILERSGTNARSYSENGLTIIYDATMLSNGLRSRLTPNAGKVK